jgi:hypothetical protein
MGIGGEMNDFADAIIIAAVIVCFIIWGTYTIIWIWQ